VISKVGGISLKINQLFKFTHGKKIPNFPKYFVGEWKNSPKNKRLHTNPLKLN
jgi:hypothetical protein